MRACCAMSWPVSRASTRSPTAARLQPSLLSDESIGNDAGQLMNMLFGNSSLLDDVEVVAVTVPDTLAARFGGPALGIEGLRRLTGASGRALSCTALKPIGSTVEDLARMTAAFAEAGIDIIKDDHGWAAHASASFEERVVACQREVDRSQPRTHRAHALRARAVRRCAGNARAAALRDRTTESAWCWSRR